MERNINIVKEFNQEITSEKTSLKQVPAVYTHYEFEDGSVVFDYGCGKYFSEVENYFRNKNKTIITLGYDPYNQDESTNNSRLALAATIGIDYIVCSNVLNVIKETESIKTVISNIAELAKDNTKIIFSIYEGDKSGVGKVTKCGYQKNQKVKEYVELLQEFFKVNKVKGKFIEVEKYKENIIYVA